MFAKQNFGGRCVAGPVRQDPSEDAWQDPSEDVWQDPSAEPIRGPIEDED